MAARSFQTPSLLAAITQNVYAPGGTSEYNNVAAADRPHANRRRSHRACSET